MCIINARQIDSSLIQLTSIFVSKLIKSTPEYLQQSKKMDDNMFEVEAILDKRINENGQLQYKILWKGYSEDHASWEPSWTLKTINSLIQQFQQQQVSFQENQHKQALKISKKNKPTIKFVEKIDPNQPVKRPTKNKMIEDKKREKLEPIGIIRNHQQILKNYQQQQNQFAHNKAIKTVTAKPVIKRQEIRKNHNKPDLFKLKLDQKLKKEGILLKTQSESQIVQNNQILEPVTVEVLKIIFKGPQHKRMFEIRVGNSIIQMQAIKTKQTYPMQLCTFYERFLRFDS